MKKTFTKKLLFEEDSFDKKSNCRNIIFRAYLKEDYIERSLKLTIENNIIKFAYFSSNNYGTSYWTNKKGVHDSHRWENEDDLAKLPDLSRHYPALLQNGEVTSEHSIDKIIPDVLDNLLDANLSKKLYRIFKSKSTKASIDWDNVVKNSKNLSDKFLEEFFRESEIKNERINKEEVNDDEVVIVKDENINKTLLDEVLTGFQKIKEYAQDKIKDTFSGEKNSKMEDKNKAKEYLKNAKDLSKKIKK